MAHRLHRPWCCLVFTVIWRYSNISKASGIHRRNGTDLVQIPRPKGQSEYMRCDSSVEVKLIDGFYLPSMLTFSEDGEVGLIFRDEEVHRIHGMHSRTKISRPWMHSKHHQNSRKHQNSCTGGIHRAINTSLSQMVKEGKSMNKAAEKVD